MYIALIGGVMATNKTKQTDARRLLVQILESINREYQGSLAVDLRFTNDGDFLGLFKTPEPLFEIIDKIKFKSHPLQLQFGVGLGAVDGDLGDREKLESSFAFQHARMGLTKVRRENGAQLSRILLSAGGDGSEFQLLNDSLKICDFVESRWRESQRELVKISILGNGHSDRILQSDLAKELGISRQAANQRVQSSGFYQFIHMKKSISETFSGVYYGLQ